MDNEFDTIPKEEKILALSLFSSLLQNEQQKAMQAVQSFREGKDFGGTSISSLIKIPPLKSQIEPQNYEELAEEIAREYISSSDELYPMLKKAFTKEEIDLFIKHGLFYGVHISPKLLALTEKLFVDHEDLLIEGFPDPYSLHKEPEETVKEYFAALKQQRGLDIGLNSIVLADTTTPRGYEGKKILNPTNLNTKLSKLSKLVTKSIRSKGRSVDPLYMLATDSDSPHRVLITGGKRPIEGYPLTPGATMCGSTAEIEGFDFKYVYRLGLIAQTLSNNIVSSKMAESFTPFMFVGMLSPFGYTNKAIATREMDRVRYPGDIDLKKEFKFQYNTCLERMI